MEQIIRKPRKSKCSLVSSILSSAYLIFTLTGFVIMMSQPATDQDLYIVITLQMQHILLVIIGLIFNWIGFASAKPWASLTAGILYSVAILVFIFGAPFIVPSLILAFVGYSKQKSMNAKINQIT